MERHINARLDEVKAKQSNLARSSGRQTGVARKRLGNTGHACCEQDKEKTRTGKEANGT
jgi:hypothetical protein